MYPTVNSHDLLALLVWGFVGPSKTAVVRSANQCLGGQSEKLLKLSSNEIVTIQRKHQTI